MRNKSRNLRGRSNEQYYLSHLTRTIDDMLRMCECALPASANDTRCRRRLGIWIGMGCAQGNWDEMGSLRAVWAADGCAGQKSRSPSASGVQGHDREICRNSSWAVVQLNARSVVCQSVALRVADAPAAAIRARPNDSRAREAFRSDRARNWRDPSTGRDARSRASHDDPCRFPWHPAISRRTKR